MSYLTQEQSDWIWFSCQLYSFRLNDTDLENYLNQLKMACYGSITSYLDERKKLNEMISENFDNDGVKGGF